MNGVRQRTRTKARGSRRAEHGRAQRPVRLHGRANASDARRFVEETGFDVVGNVNRLLQIRLRQHEKSRGMQHARHCRGMTRTAGPTLVAGVVVGRVGMRIVLVSAEHRVGLTMVMDGCSFLSTACNLQDLRLRHLRTAGRAESHGRCRVALKRNCEHHGPQQKQTHPGKHVRSVATCRRPEVVRGDEPRS